MDEQFYFHMRLEIENNMRKIESDNFVKDEIPTSDFMKDLSVFEALD